MSAISVRVFDSFASAEAVWRAFEQDAEFHAFQRFDWLRAWHEELGEDTAPLIVDVRDAEGRPVMLLPLGRSTVGDTRILGWLGGAISDYHGPLLARGTRLTSEAAGALWRDVEDALPPWDATHFERQPERVGTLLNPFAAGRGRPQVPALSATVAGWRLRPSASTRRDLRRRLRRFAEQGDLHYRIATGPAEAEELTRVMIDQKSQRYRATGAWDLFADERYRRFYLRMAREGVSSGLVHVSALLCEEHVTAVEWSLVSGGRCYGLMPSYDQSWARFAPGRVIRDHVFEWCETQGIDVYDFTVGDEPYKLHFCDQQMQTFEHVEARTPRGHLYALPRAASRIARNEVKQHPGLLAAARWARAAGRRGPLRGRTAPAE